MEGRRVSHFRGKGELFQLTFGYESETAKHLFVSKIYVLAARSFQSSDCFLFVCLFLKMRKGVCGVVVCVPGYQHKHECLACAAPFRFLPIAICFVVGCALDHSPLRLPNTRTKLGSKKCVFWYVELSLIAASLLAEEAHNNLGIFCFTLCFIKLSLV